MCLSDDLRNPFIHHQNRSPFVFCPLTAHPLRTEQSVAETLKSSWNIKAGGGSTETLNVSISSEKTPAMSSDLFITSVYLSRSEGITGSEQPEHTQKHTRKPGSGSITREEEKTWVVWWQIVEINSLKHESKVLIKLADLEPTQPITACLLDGGDVLHCTDASWMLTDVSQHK